MAKLQINWVVVAILSVALTVVLATAGAYPIWVHHRSVTNQVQAQPAPVTVDELMANLPALEGVPVSVCGRLDKGFEASDLWRGHLEPLPGYPGAALPVATIWVDIGPSDSSFVSPEQLVGHVPTHAWVIVSGRLYSGGGFGHLGTYPFRIDASRVVQTKPECAEIGA